MSFGKKPKAPKPSAQEIAVDRRTRKMLDEEIAEQESRFKALARGKLGSVSLLGGAPRSREEAASGSRSARGSAAGAGRSMLGGLSGRGSGGAPRAGIRNIPNINNISGM
tara:strand:- start:882 stop:1211 length:330 start_codon:yes stop_codon:yes gene_type:complete